jgi:tRNA-dihydrouridine synthase B
MAGISDRPFRLLCRRLGADYTITEMISASASWQTVNTQRRLDLGFESSPRVVQIAGAEVELMARCARRAERLGADIIDVNLGCPAKKVCNKLAGSALLRDEPLVREILAAVCNAVQVPVTIKMRTGWDLTTRNGVTVAKLAEDCGVHAIAVHGRTRACGYRGSAEYETIALIKQAVSIPVIANGDIDSPLSAREVLDETKADGIMIGRAAQGNPWIFEQIKAGLAGRNSGLPAIQERLKLMREHLHALYAHYGEHSGSRIARKHIGWYFKSFPEGRVHRTNFNRIDSAWEQVRFIESLIPSFVTEQAA